MVPVDLKWKSSTKLLLVTTLLLIGSCLSADQYQTMKMGNLTYQQLVTPIVVSQNDKRLYMGLRLENQLEVFLISDPQTDQASVAMNVGVGTYSNPKLIPGLAHFLEHLLFMGNKKYPDVDDYDKYLASQSGSGNAGTRNEATLYYFGIGRDSLEGGIDRFSQFFISPLFSQDSVEGESHIVDSEHKKNLMSDNWRIRQVKKSVSNPEHPYSYFGTGNYETMISIPKSNGVVIRDEIIKFYQKFYSANIMKLVVIGKESLNDLKNLVIPRFSQIKNHEVKVNHTLKAPLTKDHLGIQINVVPIKNSSTFEMEFLLPSQKMVYNEMPLRYIVYLLRHEGTDALMAQLRNLGWVYGGVNGLSENNAEFALFSIKFDLTPKGLKHTKEIMEKVFSYIRLIKDHGITEETFNEIKDIHNQTFRYEDNSPPTPYVISIASAMQSPSQLSQVLTSSIMMTIYNATLIRETLNYINPHNMRLLLASPLVADMINLKIEPYYGVKFNSERISDVILNRLSNIKPNESLKLLGPNPFVSNNFTLVTSSQSKYPEVIRNSTGQIVWYTTDKVDVPKVSLNLLIKNNQWFRSPDQQVRLTLLIDIIRDNLRSVGYMANAVGMDYTIAPEYPGIKIRVGGFSDKSSELLMTIVNQLKQPIITNQLFNLVKGRMVQNQLNFNSLPPRAIVAQNSDMALYQYTWSNQQYSEATLSLTVDDLIAFQSQNITKGALELLVVGNFDQTQSLSLMDQIQSTLNMKDVQPEFKIPRRTVVMEEGHQYVHQSTLPNNNDSNSAIEVYFDLFAYSDLKQQTTVVITSQLMENDFYNQLRTKEQLGYLVNLELKSFGSRGGLVASIQSERDPIYLESRIEDFLLQFADKVKSMTEADFRSQVESLRSVIVNRQQTLESNASIYWNAITSGYQDFNTDTTMADQLTKLTKSDIIQLVQSISPANPQRRKISFHCTSARVKTDTSMKLTEGQEKIQDLISWREEQTLSPVPFPIK